MHEIAQNVYQIPARFVNFYLIAEPDGLTLVDTGIIGDGARRAWQAIARLGRQPTELAHILIIHADPDHYGSANELRRRSGARVYASAPEAAAMARGVMSRPIRGNRLSRRLFGLLLRLLMPTEPTATDEVIAHDQTLPILGGLRVVATPGHTPGHCSFYAPALGLLFVGDSLQAPNSVAKPAPAMVTWDTQRIHESLCAQAALGAQIIAPGHGQVLRGAHHLRALCG